MTEGKIVGALGLCRRAGKVTVGAYLVKEEIRSGRAALVLIALDTGEDTKEKLLRLAEHRGVRTERIALNKAALAAAVGKEGEAVCVSVPKEFVNLVLASL
ncbi:MAG: ribosomal L7Ae/L30e/S12e/Gadd45 family protein [Clostridia bacterium]|nr:ribosomal L7Ae/L30e/S12e/Gadd45 family protein [Clostridia bacterium]